MEEVPVICWQYEQGLGLQYIEHLIEMETSLSHMQAKKFSINTLIKTHLCLLIFVATVPLILM